MDAEVIASLWQDGGHTCRKSRAPKIGDIPRHTALDVDLKLKDSDNAPPSSSSLSSASTTTSPTYQQKSPSSHQKPSPIYIQHQIENPSSLPEINKDSFTKDTPLDDVTSITTNNSSNCDKQTGTIKQEVDETLLSQSNATRPTLFSKNTSNSVIESPVPSPNSCLSEDVSKMRVHNVSSPNKLFLQSKSLGGPDSASSSSPSSSSSTSNRPIFPNCPYSPYGSPTHSPRSNRKRQPLRESRRVSIEKLGHYLQLNQYKLLDSIGQGSYGVVKLAYNQEDDSHYAMKILSKKKLFKKSGIFGRMPPKKDGRTTPSPINHPLEKVYREIAILKKLNHPNIVKLIEVLDDPDEDHLYLAFELLDRGQVLEIPTDHPLTEDKAWNYFRDVVLGIEYLHFQRIIHRDIKPANLLLNDEDRVQITDFGVCNEFHGADAFLSSTAGTPAFTPPEAVGEERLSGFSGKCTDIWALGITLYSLVYGHVPFHDNNIIGLYSKIRQKEVEFPDTPSISTELKDLITRMLVKDPSKRITLPEIKEHSWITKNGLHPLPSEEENCHLVEVTEEDVARVITSIPKLDTLILIKHMLKKHSFQNPFLHRRETLLNTSSSEPGNSTTTTAIKRHLSRSGRSNSAPDSYSWNQNRQKSCETNLEAVKEINLDPNGEEIIGTSIQQQMNNRSRSMFRWNNENIDKKNEETNKTELKQTEPSGNCLELENSNSTKDNLLQKNNLKSTNNITDHISADDIKQINER